MRARRLWCALRGHQWVPRLSTRGVTVGHCRRCREIVIAPFVGDDLPAYLEPSDPEAGLDGPLGDLAAGRSAVAYVSALAVRDWPTARAHRAALAARPLPAVTALGALAESLLAMLTEREGTVWRSLFMAGYTMHHDVAAVLHGLAFDAEGDR